MAVRDKKWFKDTKTAYTFRLEMRPSIFRRKVTASGGTDQQNGVTVAKRKARRFACTGDSFEQKESKHLDHHFPYLVRPGVSGKAHFSGSVWFFRCFCVLAVCPTAATSGSA